MEKKAIRMLAGRQGLSKGGSRGENFKKKICDLVISKKTETIEILLREKCF